MRDQLGGSDQESGGGVTEKRDMDEYDDYCGTAVECVELIDAKVPSRKKEREE